MSWYTNLSGPKKVVVNLAAVLGSIITIATSTYKIHQWIMKTYVQPYVVQTAKEVSEEAITIYYANKVGSLSANLATAMNVDRREVAPRIGEMYLNLDSVMKDIKYFHDSLMPMLRTERSTYDVGLKVNKNTGKIMYLHTDGVLYRAFQDPETKLYYFNDDDNKNQWCK